MPRPAVGRAALAVGALAEGASANQAKLVEAGAVALLVEMLKDRDGPKLQTAAAGALEGMVSGNAAAQRAFQKAGGPQALNEMVHDAKNAALLDNAATLMRLLLMRCGAPGMFSTMLFDTVALHFGCSGWRA